MAAELPRGVDGKLQNVNQKGNTVLIKQGQ
jgi:hypothetical protein